MQLIFSEQQNPLNFIKRNKQDIEIVKYLKETGIDEFVISRIIYEDFGLRHTFPIEYSKEDRKKDFKILNVIRKIQALCNNDLILEKEKKILCKIKSQLIKRENSIIHIIGTDKKKPVYIKDNKTGPLLWCAPFQHGPNNEKNDEPKAKSEKQATGLQMAALFDYIQRFNKAKYQDQEIHGLIAALNKEYHMAGHDYETDKIRKYIWNVRLVYKKIKSSKNFHLLDSIKLTKRQMEKNKKLILEAEKVLKHIEAKERRQSEIRSEIEKIFLCALRRL